MGVGSDDAVVGAELTDGRGDVFIGTRAGMAIRFKETDVRSMGRKAYGVRGVTLRDGDEVVAMTAVRPGGTLLTVTEKGYGKHTELEEYRVQSRGGVGIINIQTSEKNGQVVGVACVKRHDDLILVTQQGKILRVKTGNIRLIGIEKQDGVVSIARLVERNDQREGEEEQ